MQYIDDIFDPKPISSFLLPLDSNKELGWMKLDDHDDLLLSQPNSGTR